MIFERHEKIINIDKLNNYSIALIGVGGVGSFILEYLVRLGFNNILIVDNDLVDKTNLNRQILYDLEDVGKEKVKVAKEKMLKINPDLNLEISKDLDDNLNKYDIIIDAVDSEKTKRMLANIAFENSKVFINTGVSEFYGHAAILFNKNSFEKIKFNKQSDQISILTCSIIASFAVKLILNYILKEDKHEYFYYFDNNEVRKYRLGDKYV